jgi:hypothetical protein
MLSALLLRGGDDGHHLSLLAATTRFALAAARLHDARPCAHALVVAFVQWFSSEGDSEEQQRDKKGMAG